MTKHEDYKAHGKLPTAAELFAVSDAYLTALDHTILEWSVAFINEDGWRVHANVDTNNPDIGVEFCRIRGFYENGVPVVDELH